MFLQLTRILGTNYNHIPKQTVCVNTDHITWFKPIDEGTKILLIDHDECMIVSESYDKIKNTIGINQVS